MDRIRLESAFREITTAQEAYDSALRVFTDATSATDGSTPAAQLEAAEAALVQARLRLESARGALDANRLAELATFETSDQLLGTIAGDQVIALFPAGVEAKLDPGRLRIRV